MRPYFAKATSLYVGYKTTHPALWGEHKSPMIHRHPMIPNDPAAGAVTLIEKSDLF